MSTLLETFEKKQIERLTGKKRIPTFRPGDTLKITIRITEGDKSRLQAFEGMCIARKNNSVNSNFTVRKLSHGEGVERVFPLFSPIIEKIEVIKITPQIYAGESISPLIQDPWMTIPCTNYGECIIEFEDQNYSRDSVYYVRAIQESTPAINGSKLSGLIIIPNNSSPSVAKKGNISSPGVFTSGPKFIGSLHLFLFSFTEIHKSLPP